LHEHDARFQFWHKRGKGSERIIYHPDINGQPQQIPLTFHKGQDIGKGLLKAIIRRFSLPGDIFG
jgi:predicted RNA binding protein YcfA (HicA-like mRNA interferase family)